MTSATVAPLILRLDQAPASKKNMNYDLILAKAFEFQRKLPADVQRVVGVADCVALVLACLASGRHFRLTPIDADGCGVEVITQPGSNRSPLQESPGQESQVKNHQVKKHHVKKHHFKNHHVKKLRVTVSRIMV